MKKIAVLGSTGSIGTQTLKVIEHLKGQYQVAALAACSNIDALAKQITMFDPEMIGVFDPQKAVLLQKQFANKKIMTGMDGLLEIVTRDDIDIVICAISGNIALLPTMKAIEKGKTIGLANKEVLVAAGELIIEKAKQHKATLLPIDSEHNAIFQCLVGEKKEEVHRLILTASGGPFFHLSKDQLQKVSYEDALLHPTYSMGKKISIDSSTLMNKGLEIIEAHFLFDISLDRIDVVIHPQSIVHSMVEFVDGSIKAQLSEPDMRVPIQYVLTYPNRETTSCLYFDFTRMHDLQFFPPDPDKFKCLQLAKDALKSKRSYPCYLNAANEILVDRFLKKEISWCDIAHKLDKLMSSHHAVNVLNLETVFEVDMLARTEAKHI